MYGTICRFQLKPGMESQLEMLNRDYEVIKIAGHVGQMVFRMDSNPNEYYLVVIFESEEAYKKNAASPEQDARYRRFRDLMAADPEWHDGTLIYGHTAVPIEKVYSASQ
jgi:quinol monooxygenase YgiN